MNVIAEPAMQFGMLQGMGIDGEKMRLGVGFFSASAFGKLIQQTQAGVGAAPDCRSAEWAGTAFLICFYISSGPFLEDPHSAFLSSEMVVGDLGRAFPPVHQSNSILERDKAYSS